MKPETVTTIEPCYQNRAKDLVNLLFDKRFLADDLTRECTQWLEDYLALIISQTAESATRCAVLLQKIETRSKP